MAAPSSSTGGGSIDPRRRPAFGRPWRPAGHHGSLTVWWRRRAPTRAFARADGCAELDDSLQLAAFAPRLAQSGPMCGLESCSVRARAATLVHDVIDSLGHPQGREDIRASRLAVRGGEVPFSRGWRESAKVAALRAARSAKRGDPGLWTATTVRDFLESTPRADASA